MSQNLRDELWMREALAEARQCLARIPADVPVGAVCVFEGEVISRAHNRRELDADPTAHAEVLALRAAAEALGRWRLDGVTLYVTLEPCPMCAGALWLARIDRLVYGARDPKAGACGSLFDTVRDPRLNHRPELRSGVLAADSAELLQAFFATRRPNEPRALGARGVAKQRERAVGVPREVL